MSTREALHLKVCCQNIRHKMMYVDARQAVRGLVDDSSDTTVYFCIRSHEVLGPDGKAVSPRECTPDRPCYQPGP